MQKNDGSHQEIFVFKASGFIFKWDNFSSTNEEEFESIRESKRTGWLKKQFKNHPEIFTSPSDADMFRVEDDIMLNLSTDSVRSAHVLQSAISIDGKKPFSIEDRGDLLFSGTLRAYIVVESDCKMDEALQKQIQSDIAVGISIVLPYDNYELCASEWRESDVVPADELEREEFQKFLDALKSDAQIRLAAVRRHAYTLNYVPDDLKTPELCLAAVQNRGRMLAYVPDTLKTPDLCLAAVKNENQNTDFLREVLAIVPESVKSHDFFLAAVSGPCGMELEYVPEKFITPELLIAGLAVQGVTLESGLEKLTLPEFWLAVVKADSSALKYVPKALITPELCQAALPWGIGYVPKTLLTPEMCLAAVKATPLVLSGIPEAMRTPEIYLAAVQAMPFLLNSVPESMRTPEILRAAGQN